MKKLMTTMAALVTGLCVWADGDASFTKLANVFDAASANAETWASDTSTGGKWGGSTDTLLSTESKVCLTEVNEAKVLKISTGSDWLQRFVNADGSYFSIAESNVYFDVHLDTLDQSMDELPTNLPDDAKFALFMLDTSSLDDVADNNVSTGLFAIAGNPDGKGGTVLLKYNCTKFDKRLTIKGYSNVLNDTATPCAGFLVFKDGDEATSGTADPIEIDLAYSITSDGKVDWDNAITMSSYLDGQVKSTLDIRRKCLALSIQNGEAYATATSLDFAGNALISKVEINNTGFSFIAPDEQSAGVALENVEIDVAPAESYDSTSKKFTGNATIYARSTSKDTLPIVTVTKGASYLTAITKGAEGWTDHDDYDYAWTYDYKAGQDIGFKASPAAVSATFTVDDADTTVSFSSFAEALAALADNYSSATKAEFTLNEDATIDSINFADIEIVLDLNGRTLIGTDTSSNGAVVYANNKMTIKDGSEAQTGRIAIDPSAGEGTAAVAVVENSSGFTIEGGIFDGAVTVTDTDVEYVTLSGGSYLASANSTEASDGGDATFALADYLASGKTATKQTDGDVDYWVVGDKSTAQYTVTFKKPDPANPDSEYTTTIVKTLNEDGTVTPPETPTAEGWTFLGWFQTDEEGNLATTAFDFATQITENITLTAKWSNWATVLDAADTDGAYKIDDETDLKAFAANVGILPTAGVSFKLTGNIVLTSTWAGIGIYDKTVNANAFEGTFDGGNFTISNVVFSDNGSEKNTYRGFFNQIYNATVKNLTVDGSGFGTSVPSGEYGCALVVGCANNSTIENCTAIGTIASGTHNVAGIVVRIKDSTIKGCTNKAAITCGYTKVGGIAAISQYSTEGNGCLIENCANEGTVTADGGTTAGQDGLAGILAYTADGDSIVTIKGCSNKGSLVKGTTASSIAKIGQIIGYAYKTIKDDGGNTGLADVASVGSRASGVTAIDGLTFATVADDTATFVANSAVTVGSGVTYKVMASGAAYTMTALGSITFDTTLADVNVTQGGEYESTDAYTLTPAAASDNEKLITYTLAKKETVEPVSPETLKPCESDTAAQALADAINNDSSLIAVPDGLTDETAQATYRGLFEAKVVTDSSSGTTTYSVEVVLKSDKVTEIQNAVDTDTKALELSKIAALSEGSVSQSLTTKPGIYYSVVAGDSINGMKVRSCTMAKGESLDVTLPHYDGAGFYRIKATVKAETVE